MRAVAAAILLVASASAAPQISNIFKALSGDDEPGEVNGDYESVPYTTLKKYDVRHSHFLFLESQYRFNGR